MVRGEETKAAALVLTALCITSAICTHFGGVPVDVVALCKDCTILARLSYSFFHANMLHAIVNCWCLLSITFIYKTNIYQLAFAFLMAVTFPIGFLCEYIPMLATAPPTVGLSAVVYCMLGQISWQSAKKWVFHIWVFSFIVASFIMPTMFTEKLGVPMAMPNNTLHIYCYVVGLMVGFLNYPAPWRK